MEAAEPHLCKMPMSVAFEAALAPAADVLAPPVKIDEAVGRPPPQVQFDSKRTQSPAYETCNCSGP